MRPRVRLKHLYYIPSHRDPYDPRFIQSATLYAAVDVHKVDGRRIKRFIISLASHLNDRYPYLTTIFHHRDEDLLRLWISAGCRRDFDKQDFERLRDYLDDAARFCVAREAQVVRWTRDISRRTVKRGWSESVYHYGGLEIEALSKKKRDYADELYLAILNEKQAVRRIKAAFRDDAVATIAHISAVKEGCDFYLTLVDVVSRLIEPKSWEDRAYRLITEKGKFAPHLKAAWKLDRNKTMDLLDLCWLGFIPRATKVLGNPLRRARKGRTPRKWR